MFWSGKSRSRREEIRRNRPCGPRSLWQELRDEGALPSLTTAVAFCIVAAGILLLRENVVSYRPGQFVSHDIVSRVDFTYRDADLLVQARQQARETRPRIYRSTGDVWGHLEEQLKALPDRVAGASTLDEIEQPLRSMLDSGALTRLQQYHSDPHRAGYEQAVAEYVQSIREWNPVILPHEQRLLDQGRQIELPGGNLTRSDTTYSTQMREELSLRLQERVVAQFLLELQPKILGFTLQSLQPTHVLDEVATFEARNRAAEAVPSTAASIDYKANMILVPRGVISERDWQVLRAENDAFIAGLDRTAWRSRIGVIAIAVMVTVLLSIYIARYQRRVLHNHARAVAIAALMLSMLLLAQLAGIGSTSLYVFGIAPTILVAMILAIAYDQRFAVGVGTVQAILVTVALNQGIEFFVIAWVGVLACCFLLDDIRTRSKLIEVGGATALAMMVATAGAGLLSLDPLPFIARNCLYSGAAGLTVGFVVLGILPFIEKSFRITTSMTLLELADASQPLLRRLAMEAPGTYNHSLQVGTLAEAAAEAVGGNSLLCRVASYYHDIGKINKAEYFVENQVDGQNRHINLSPSVSLLIIIGHVKDGVEMAKEYNLPTSLLPFIQQHHGTTLVEYFYHQACTQKQQRHPDQPAISETQYRYPGPRPRTREIAIVMMADAVESATRTMVEPTASRIESLVHELTMKRLLDGQFDECDLTMRELELIERSLVKTLLGIYHGRVAYPSSMTPPLPAPSSLTTIKTA